jgi:hypothetical protein
MLNYLEWLAPFALIGLAVMVLLLLAGWYDKEHEK